MGKLVLAVSLGVLFLMTYSTAIKPAYALSYALCLLFIGAWAWPRAVIGGLTVKRTLNPSTPTVGEQFEEEFEVRRTGWLPAPWVEVRDRGEMKGYQPGRVISIGTEPMRWTAKGVYMRRGWCSFGPTLVSAAEPFGLFRRSKLIAEKTPVLVYPRVTRIPDLLTPTAHQAGNSPRLGSWSDYPPETGGVRDYVTGDAFSRIHWPLSARHQRLMSKTFEQPLTSDIWVLLDLDRDVHYGDGDDSTVEYAIQLAASVSVQVLSRGRQVGLIANDGVGTILEPHRAVRQDKQILDYLAVAKADGRTPLATALAWDRIRRLPRRAVAVITPSSEKTWVRYLEAVRGRRTTLIVFYIDVASFGGPDTNPTFDLGQDVDLYVVHKGDDFNKLTRTRDAIRFA
jgi:uncharacterized protein (DUF58 family)